MSRLFCACLALIHAIVVAQAAEIAVPAPAMIVLDSSGSMAGRIADGRVKLDAARDIVTDTLTAWPANGEVGLIAYGHRRAGDCSDIQTILPLGPLSTAAVRAAVNALMARGKTPISRALEVAEAQLPRGTANIVLLSDGIETCEADPCATAAALRAAHPGLAIDVIGFGLEEGDAAQLACIADRAGGRFFDARDAAGLTQALETVKSEAAMPVADVAEPTPADQPAPFPYPPAVVRTHIAATAGERGATIDSSVRWLVEDSAGARVYEGESRALVLELLPGGYDVTAFATNATGQGRIEVGDDQEQSFEIALAAGQIELSLTASPDGPAYSEQEASGIAWTVRPLDGQPVPSVPAIARPSLLLATGRYRVEVTLGDLSAGSEFRVLAGKQLKLPLSLRIGTLALEAVLGAGAEPITDDAAVSWRVEAGDDVRLIDGEAQPSMVLPEGTYVVTLMIAGAQLTQVAEVKAGNTVTAEVLVPGGTLALSAQLGPQSPPLDDWRDTFWTVRPVAALGDAATLEAQEPLPNLPLPAGRWTVTLVSGATTVEREIVITPGATTNLKVVLRAARLAITADVDGAASSGNNVVYAVTAIDGSGTLAKIDAFEAGASEGASTILPAGHWHISADDLAGRHAETDIELSSGEEKAVPLILR